MNHQPSSIASILPHLHTSILLLVLLLGLAGCGGGSPKDSSSGQSNLTAPTGSVRLEVAWPATQAESTLKRVIPLNTRSIRISINDPNTSAPLISPIVIVRTADPIQRVTINGIRAGAVRVAAQAFATPDASGNPIATGSSDAMITAGQTSNVNVTLFAFAPPPPPL